MQNLMQIPCSTRLIILNATTTQYTFSLNRHLQPPLSSTVKSSLFMHVHSSPLSLDARLCQCHSNHSCYINNGWTFSGQTHTPIIVQTCHLLLIFFSANIYDVLFVSTNSHGRMLSSSWIMPFVFRGKIWKFTFSSSQQDSGNTLFSGLSTVPAHLTPPKWYCCD